MVGLSSTVALIISIKVFADNTSRLDFKTNLGRHNASLERFINEQLFAAEKHELKNIRSNMIWRIHFDQNYEYGQAHVTAAFDVTDLIPHRNERLDYRKLSSFVVPDLETIGKTLAPEGRRPHSFEVINSSSFHRDHSSNKIIESVELILDRRLFDRVFDHPRLQDMSLWNVRSQVRFKDDKARINERTHIPKYNDHSLFRGFYREVEEGLALHGNVKAHVVFNDNAPHDKSTLFTALEDTQFALIREEKNELFAEIDRTALDILAKHSQVRLIKDFMYHHQLDLDRGKWRPLPTSLVTNATANEASPLMRKIKSNLHSQGHEVIENDDQFKEFIELISSSPYTNKRVLLGKLSDSRPNLEEHNLILISHTEHSGSIGVIPRAPQWIDGELTIALDRGISRSIGGTMGFNTANEVQYSLLYLVSKAVPEVLIRDHRQVTRLKNQHSEFKSTHDRLERENRRHKIQTAN